MSSRFGPIVAVSSKRNIKKGEELFSNYGYKGPKPKWYSQLQKDFEAKKSCKVWIFFKKMVQYQPLFVYFQNPYYRKLIDFTGIWTRIVGIEEEQADHLTTTTANCTSMWKTVPTYIAFLYELFE